MCDRSGDLRLGDAVKKDLAIAGLKAEAVGDIILYLIVWAIRQ